MRDLQRLLGVADGTRILDIGGTPDIWQLLDVRPQVTLVNMPRAREEVAGGFLWVAADGRALPFRDRAFDIVFSNSVIEHVGGPESQQRFARETLRVGNCCYVQTPNRWFPVETHLLTPFLHWLPKPWQQALVPRFTIWGLVSGAVGERREFYLNHYLREVRLLDAREMRDLFPGAAVHRERFLGWTKSLIAVRRPAQPGS